MGAGMAVAADDQATGKAEAKLGSDHMDDALPGFIDIEHPDAGRRRLGPQPRQKHLSDLAGAGPSARRRNRMIRRSKRQFGIMHRQVAVFEIEQATRAAQIVQQMTVDVKQIGVVADATDDVLVPNLGQQGSAGRLHCRILPFLFFHGRLMHRHRPFCRPAIQVSARTRFRLSKHIEALGPTPDLVGQAPHWRGTPPDRSGVPKSIPQRA